MKLTKKLLLELIAVLPDDAVVTIVRFDDNTDERLCTPCRAVEVVLPRDATTNWVAHPGQINLY